MQFLHRDAVGNSTDRNDPTIRPPLPPNRPLRVPSGGARAAAQFRAEVRWGRPAGSERPAVPRGGRPATASSSRVPPSSRLPGSGGGLSPAGGVPVAPSPPIAEHGLIGDLQTAALVATDG